MHHGPEFTIVFILCFTLAVGALLRQVCARLRIPYTIGVLLVGLAAGLVLHITHHDGPFHLLTAGSKIGHELIIFVFLPALVFESAFSIKVHAFFKDLKPVVLLAVPALLVSTLLVGLLMFGLTHSGWGWSFTACLVFGALISATDPVAVVALLKELGAPKRLGLLIEGESLFNDGTAIVVFGVLLSLLAKGVPLHAGHTLLHFLLVTVGGILVGLVLAIACTAWLGRTFNDPLVEITITLLLAYLSMVLAEGMLHVSGVMAVVASGLWMSGPGRTAISPEVEHFLHRFWEMLSYLANTLIFFLVGLVIAAQGYGADLKALGLILVTYVGVMAIRGIIVMLFRPMMARVSYPEATVMAWGGLRGAVSLALALVFTQEKALPLELREQLLLVTAGVVFLTILVNGGTLAWLLRRLGLDQAPAGSRLAALNTRSKVLKKLRDSVREVSRKRDLRTVQWTEIDDELEQGLSDNEQRIAAVRTELLEADEKEQARGSWRQVLEIERLASWRAYAQGCLEARSARILDQEVNLRLDRLESGEEIGPPQRADEYVGFLRRVSGLAPFARFRFGALALRHDLARGQSLAAEAVLSELDEIEGMDDDIRTSIEAHYRALQRCGRETLEDLRSNLPEVTRAIETRLARRVLLNLERDAYEELAHLGALDPGAAEEAIAEVEQGMKLVARHREGMALPETADLVHDAELFRDLGKAELQKLADITLERVLSPGELLFSKGDRGESLFIIARGAVLVYDGEVLLDILGGGDMFGEISLLTEAPRSCSIQAATTVTLGEISRADFEDLLNDAPGLREATWGTLARRRFEDMLRGDPSFDHLGHRARVAWFASSEQHFLKEGQKLKAETGRRFLAVGELTAEGQTMTGPAWVPHDTEWKATSLGWLAELPAFEPGSPS
jgi:NhaP-type Na+/H+ or K+/H+ antiporter